MWCLKCGKDTKNEQVFCPQCLAGMDAYPVKPDVHIQLPSHNTRDFTKKNAKKKRTPSPEEMVEVLRSRNRRLLALVLALMLALGALGYAYFKQTTAPVSEENKDQNVGKNYTVITDK